MPWPVCCGCVVKVRGLRCRAKFCIKTTKYIQINIGFETPPFWFTALFYFPRSVWIGVMLCCPPLPSPPQLGEHFADRGTWPHLTWPDLTSPPDCCQCLPIQAVHQPVRRCHWTGTKTAVRLPVCSFQRLRCHRQVSAPTELHLFSYLTHSLEQGSIWRSYAVTWSQSALPCVRQDGASAPLAVACWPDLRLFNGNLYICFMSLMRATFSTHVVFFAMMILTAVFQNN
jgi:hypothetical protein